MPLTTSKYNLQHRHKLHPNQGPLFNAMVARDVYKDEVRSNPKAQKAMDDEYAGLRKAGVWLEDEVQEWNEVRKKAKKDGKEVHVGRIFGICVEKNTQFSKNDPLRKFKGRFVFQGNDVRNEYFEYAFFEDVASAPAALEAGKACDVHGSLDGHVIMQCDAQQAYIQTDLGGEIPTWVRLPREFWPKWWAKKYTDPVVPLIKALYGHPRAGNCWEKHAEAHFAKAGFLKIPEWNSCYYNKKLKLFLTVYVDDLKMSGPRSTINEGWRLIRRSIDSDGGIRTDEPVAVNKYLGADHRVGERRLPTGKSADSSLRHVRLHAAVRRQIPRLRGRTWSIDQLSCKG